jgi:hypothetical protein
MAVMNVVVVVATAVVVVAGNVLSALKALPMRVQLLSLATRLEVHGLHPVWLDHRQPFPPAS